MAVDPAAPRLGRRVADTGSVDQYYDLVTDFYEFGWGRSFHFAPRRQGETLQESLSRFERDLAAELDLQPGWEVLDVGCGVGGPMIEIARASGASITGVNNNQHQIDKGERYVGKVGLADRCRFVKADYMSLPMNDATFDAAYALEATCHAPKRVDLYRGLLRILKPGRRFADVSWCLTHRFEPQRPEHRLLKVRIERANALPQLGTIAEARTDLVTAGFEIVGERDLTEDPGMTVPWYSALTGRERRLASLPRTPLGRRITRRAVGALEAIRIAPSGSKQVSDLLNEAADALVEAGELGIFTPSYLFMVRKTDRRARSKTGLGTKRSDAAVGDVATRPPRTQTPQHTATFARAGSIVLMY